MKVVGARQQRQYDFFCALFFLLMLFSSARGFLVKEVCIEVIYMNATVYNDSMAVLAQEESQKSACNINVTQVPK
jgi:hypothetical protein